MVLELVVPDVAPRVAPAPVPELPLMPELAPDPELPLPDRALSLPLSPPHAESANVIVIPAVIKIFFI